MPTKKRKPAPRKLSTFDLDADILAKLDSIAQLYSDRSGFSVSRVGAIRSLIRREWKRLDDRIKD